MKRVYLGTCFSARDSQPPDLRSSGIDDLLVLFDRNIDIDDPLQSEDLLALSLHEEEIRLHTVLEDENLPLSVLCRIHELRTFRILRRSLRTWFIIIMIVFVFCFPFVLFIFFILRIIIFVLVMVSFLLRSFVVDSGMQTRLFNVHVLFIKVSMLRFLFL